MDYNKSARYGSHAKHKHRSAGILGNVDETMMAGAMTLGGGWGAHSSSSSSLTCFFLAASGTRVNVSYEGK